MRIIIEDTGSFVHGPPSIVLAVPVRAQFLEEVRASGFGPPGFEAIESAPLHERLVCHTRPIAERPNGHSDGKSVWFQLPARDNENTPDGREVESEVGQKPVDLGHELRGPPPDHALVCARP